MVKVGIIGGSGLDNPDILKDAKEVVVKTEFGAPSDKIKTGKIDGVKVAILPRHGKKHTIPPTHVNYRANIAALKKLGVTHIIATTACGSLKKEIGRGHFVILDQFIDFTRNRELSFFEEFKDGKIKHTPMADPFSEDLRKVLIDSAKETGIKYHDKGTVVTIEGPRFSTRGESKMFSLWGADVINMSIAPECALANEAEIPYAAVAMATDYDCLFDDVPPVTWDEVLSVFGKNVDKVIKLLMGAIPKIGELK
ncbi:S-methyl-5'-thioadenosine phosphorylase [Candidatus Woesearchaeota archaeon]|nr:S-methyl-5'-thioadenosine phosphorylase [Candidatus Woesearchaeota archaeon]